MLWAERHRKSVMKKVVYWQVLRNRLESHYAPVDTGRDVHHIPEANLWFGWYYHSKGCSDSECLVDLNNSFVNQGLSHRYTYGAAYPNWPWWVLQTVVVEKRSVKIQKSPSILDTSDEESYSPRRSSTSNVPMIGLPWPKAEFRSPKKLNSAIRIVTYPSSCRAVYWEPA